MDSPSIVEQAERPYISTGHLPEPETVQKLVSEAHQRFKPNSEGQNSQVDLDNITFVSNDRLRGVLERTTATREQVSEAVRINTKARLRALKMGLLIMALVAMLSIFPAGRLPNYRPGELPSEPPISKNSGST
jgi:hypothetical protein